MTKVFIADLNSGTESAVESGTDSYPNHIEMTKHLGMWRNSTPTLIPKETGTEML